MSTPLTGLIIGTVIIAAMFHSLSKAKAGENYEYTRKRTKVVVAIIVPVLVGIAFLSRELFIYIFMALLAGGMGIGLWFRSR